jgi:hypothetical protein
MPFRYISAHYHKVWGKEIPEIRDILTPSWWFSTVLVAVAVNLLSAWLYEKLKNRSVVGVVSKWIRWLSIANAVAIVFASIVIAWKLQPPDASLAWVLYISFIYLALGGQAAFFVKCMLNSPAWSLLTLSTTLGILSMIYTYRWGRGEAWHVLTGGYWVAAVVGASVMGMPFVTYKLYRKEEPF